MKIKYTEEEKAEQIIKIKDWLKQADFKVYSIVRNVSKSGMSRDIDFYCLIPNSKADIKKGCGAITKMYLSYAIAGLLDYPFNDNKGVKVSGCGMDMAYSVVYNLSMALYCGKKYNHDKAYKLSKEEL